MYATPPLPPPLCPFFKHGASQESFIRAEETSNQSVHNAVYDFASLGHTHLLKVVCNLYTMYSIIGAAVGSFPWQQT